MKNFETAKLFYEMADLLEIKVKNLGIGLVLSGVALLVYNLFNYQPSHGGIIPD
jgi:hypothetical protein